MTKEATQVSIDQLIETFRPGEEVAGMLYEAYLLPDRGQQKTFLVRALTSYVRESFYKPFHSLVLEFQHTQSHEVKISNQFIRKKVSLKDNKSSTVVDFDLVDSFYGANPSTIDRCLAAIGIATGSTAERYQRELEQVALLAKVIGAEFPKLSYPLLEILSQSNQEYGFKHLESDLLAQGWIHQQRKMSAEIMQKYGLQTSEPVIVGPQYLYIMPQSKVHGEEWASMYLVAQPVYVPKLQKVLLFQDQHMCQPNWAQHLGFLQSVTNKTFTADSEHWEEYVMGQNIQLPDSFQTNTPQESLKKIMYIDNADIFGIFTDKSENIENVLETLEAHAEYLLDILEMDNAWDPTWNKQKNTRMYQAIFNTIGMVLQKESVTAAEFVQWKEIYRQTYSSESRRNDAESYGTSLRLSIGEYSPPMLNAISSKLECTLFAMAKIDSNPAFISTMSAEGVGALSVHQINQLSSEQKAMLKTRYASEYVKRELDGEIWFVHKKYARHYTNKTCRKNARGQVVGPCKIWLGYDSYCLSEAAYQERFAAADQSTQSEIESKFNQYSQEDQQLVMYVWQVLQDALLSSVNLTQAINGISFNPEVESLLNLMSGSVDPLEIVKSPEFLAKVLPLAPKLRKQFGQPAAQYPLLAVNDHQISPTYEEQYLQISSQ